MEALREFFVSLGLDADAASWAQAQATVSALELGLKKVVEAVQFVAGEMVKSVTETAAYADHLDDVSQRTGISTEALQTLGYAAGLTGASMESVQAGVQHLARTMAEAAGGSKTAREALAALGVKATDADGKLRKPEEALNDVADGAARLTNDAERTAAVLAVLGRGGTELIPMLRGGSEGLRAAAEEADGLGIVMGEKALKASAAFADNLDRLHGFVDGLRRQLGGLLIEALGPTVEAMVAWAKANRAAIGVKLTEFVGALTKAARFLFNVLRPMAEVVMTLVKAWRVLAVLIGSYLVAQLLMGAAALVGQTAALAAAAQGAMAYAAASISAGVSAAAAWVAATWPLLALAAGIALLILAIDEVNVALQDGDSLLTRYGWRVTKLINELTAPNAGDMWIVKQLRFALKLVTDLEGQMLPWLKEKLKGTMFEIPEREFEGVSYGAPDMQAMKNRAAELYGPLYTPKSGTSQNSSASVVNHNNITVNAKSNEPREIAETTGQVVHDVTARNSAENAEALNNAGFVR